jgi:hypothetical protein
MQFVVDRPKKRRARRGEPEPDDAVLVVRGDLIDSEVVATLVTTSTSTATSVSRSSRRWEESI